MFDFDSLPAADQSALYGGAAPDARQKALLDSLLAQTPDAPSDFWGTLDTAFKPMGEDWWSGRKDPLMQMAEIAAARWGWNRVLGTFRSNPRKAWYMGQSGLGIGPALYDKTGDGSRARLLYVPGYKPRGFADEIYSNRVPTGAVVR